MGPVQFSRGFEDGLRYLSTLCKVDKLWSPLICSNLLSKAHLCENIKSTGVVAWVLQPHQHCFSLMFFLSFNNKDKSDKSTFLITSWFQLSHRWTGYRLPRPAGNEIEILICQFFQSHTVSSLPWTSTSWWSCHRRQWQGAGGRWGRRQHSWHTGHDVKWQHCIPSACDSWQFLSYDCTLVGRGGKN